jgi:hypothetical protein
MNNNIAAIINGLQQHLRNYLDNPLYDEDLNKLVNQAHFTKNWFTPDFIKQRLAAISNADIKNWEVNNATNNYPNQIAFWSDERIPLDALSILFQLMAVNVNVTYKTNDLNDKVLEHLIKLLPNNLINFSNKPNKQVTAYIIDHKNNNPALNTYLHHYNSLIINKQGMAAVLTGNETPDNLELLAGAIFNYYGQGKHSVRKVFVPAGFEIRQLYSYFEKYAHYINNHNWANNYQYNQSVYLMNRITFFDNGFLILKEDNGTIAPTGVLFYEYYSNKTEIELKIANTPEYTNLYQVDKFNNCLALGVYDYFSLQPNARVQQFINTI